MQRLKSVQHSLLTESIQRILSHNRIITVPDFLQEDAEKISTLTKLNLAQVIDIKSFIIKKYSAPLINGVSLLEQHGMRKQNLSTGIESLDTALNGGLPIDCIIELCGLADSGKTQLCFQLAVNCVKNCDNTVLYVDTKGDFSAVRIQKILDATGHSHKDMALIMLKIRVAHTWTMEELIDLLRNLKNRAMVIENLSLIIVDSLPCLMFQHLGDENKIGLSMLNTFVNYSRYLCKELNISMVCVNLQTRWVEQDVADIDDEEQSISVMKESAYVEKRNRCLGRYWQHIPTVVLLLDKHQEQQEHCQINVSKMENMKFVFITTLKFSASGIT